MDDASGSIQNLTITGVDRLDRTAVLVTLSDGSTTLLEVEKVLDLVSQSANRTEASEWPE